MRVDQVKGIAGINGFVLDFQNFIVIQQGDDHFQQRIAGFRIINHEFFSPRHFCRRFGRFFFYDKRFFLYNGSFFHNRFFYGRFFRNIFFFGSGFFQQGIFRRDFFGYNFFSPRRLNTAADDDQQGQREGKNSFQVLIHFFSTSLVCVEYALCKRACFEQRKAQQNGVAHDRPDGEGNVVLHHHVLNKNGVDRYANND